MILVIRRKCLGGHESRGGKAIGGQIGKELNIGGCKVMKTKAVLGYLARRRSYGLHLSQQSNTEAFQGAGWGEKDSWRQTSGLALQEKRRLWQKTQGCGGGGE